MFHIFVKLFHRWELERVGELVQPLGLLRPCDDPEGEEMSKAKVSFINLHLGKIIDIKHQILFKVRWIRSLPFRGRQGMGDQDTGAANLPCR